VASIVEAAPRVLALVGPAGYRKSQLLGALARSVGPMTACDLARPDGDLARAVLDTLIAADRPRAARSAADRLAQPRELAPATTRESLRGEWPIATERSLFVLNDPSAVLATAAGVDLITEEEEGYEVGEATFEELEVLAKVVDFVRVGAVNEGVGAPLPKDVG